MLSRTGALRFLFSTRPLSVVGTVKHWYGDKGFLVADAAPHTAAVVYERDLIFARPDETRRSLALSQRVEYDVEPRFSDSPSSASSSSSSDTRGKRLTYRPDDRPDDFEFAPSESFCIVMQRARSVTAVGGMGLPSGPYGGAGFLSRHEARAERPDRQAAQADAEVRSSGKLFRKWRADSLASLQPLIGQQGLSAVITESAEFDEEGRGRRVHYFVRLLDPQYLSMLDVPFDAQAEGAAAALPIGTFVRCDIAAIADLPAGSAIAQQHGKFVAHAKNIVADGDAEQQALLRKRLLIEENFWTTPAEERATKFGGMLGVVASTWDKRSRACVQLEAYPASCVKLRVRAAAQSPSNNVKLEVGDMLRFDVVEKKPTRRDGTPRENAPKKLRAVSWSKA